MRNDYSRHPPTLPGQEASQEAWEAWARDASFPLRVQEAGSVVPASCTGDCGKEASFYAPSVSGLQPESNSIEFRAGYQHSPPGRRASESKTPF